MRRIGSAEIAVWTPTNGDTFLVINSSLGRAPRNPARRNYVLYFDDMLYVSICRIYIQIIDYRVTQ